MNLSLNSRGDYAVRAALCLARAYDGRTYKKTREIASDMALPVRYTPQILTTLNRAGIADARAGREGGYRLSRPPAEVSLLAVVEAAEGPLRSGRCTLDGGPCHWERMCAVHPAWEEAAESFRRALERVSLADIAAVDAGLESGTYPVDSATHRSTGRESKS